MRLLELLKRCAVAFLMLALQAQALAHIAQPTDLGSFEKYLVPPTLVGDKDALEGNFGLGQRAGENAVKNNYLKFDEIKRLQSEMAQCENQAGGCSTQQRQGIEEKYTLTSRANAQALAECKSVACVESHQKAIAQAGRAGADPLGQYDSMELAQRQRLAEAAVQRQYAIALKIEQSRREMDTLIAGQCQGLSSGACTAKLAQSQEAASQIMDIAAGFTPLGVAVDIRDFVSDPSIAGALMIVAGPVGEAVKVLRGLDGGVVPGSAGDSLAVVAKPTYVFRGDGRPPTKIFDEGFKASGTNTDVLNHATTNSNSGLISTSSTPTVAREFADLQVGGYVYTIRKPSQALDVNATLGAKSPYPQEFEIAVPSVIHPQDIMGARQVGPDGKFVGPFVKNPGFK